MAIQLISTERDAEAGLVFDVIGDRTPFFHCLEPGLEVGVARCLDRKRHVQSLEAGTILDVYCAKTLPPDTQIAWQGLTRNLGKLETVVADKGFDWDDLRHKLRDEGIRPVIKHREFYSLDAAHNARIDDKTYHQRSIVEAIFFALRKRFGSVSKARTWFGQFREIVLKAAVRNIEQSLTV